MDRVITQAGQLSAVIKTTRKSAGIDQVHLANLMGLTQGRYSQLESDIPKLTVDRLLVILNALGLECVIREQQSMQLMVAEPTAHYQSHGKPHPQPSPGANRADTGAVAAQPVTPPVVGDALKRLQDRSAIGSAMKQLTPIVKVPSLGFKGPVTRFGTPAATLSPAKDDQPAKTPDEGKGGNDE